MKDELKYIDELYKSNLENYQEESGKDIWKNMRWMLFWMRYRWIMGIGLVVLFLSIGSFFFMNTSGDTEISNTIENNKTESTLHTNSQPEEVLQTENSTYSTIQNDATNTISLSKTTDIPVLNNSQPSINLPIETNEISNINETSTNSLITNHDISLEEIDRKEFNNNITGLPDSNLLGYNRRTDIQLQPQTNHRFSLNIYAGPAISQLDISGYNSEYLTYRNDNESSKPGWSMGMDIKFHIKNWVISSGLNYSVYNQLRSYSHSFQVYSPDDSYFNYDTTWNWVFDPPNYGTPIVAGIDSSWVEVYNIITIDNSGQNKLKYFEIPVMVGYSFNSNLFTFEINAGVSAGFLVYSNIKVPDFNNYDDIIIVEQMNNTIFNIVANASVYYHINPKISVFVSPYYKQNLVSVFNNDYPVKQIFKTSGINLGISFQF